MNFFLRPAIQFKSLYILCVCFSLPNLQGATHSTSVLASSCSLVLGSATSSESGGKLAVFSTYDGIANWPQGFLSGINLSQELKPDSFFPNSSIYRADLAVYSYASGQWGGYGNVRLNLPTTDANGNGFPDFLEIGQSVALTSISGFVDEEYNGLLTPFDHSINLTLSRAANAYQGTYTSKAAHETVGYAGNFQLKGGRGTCVFDDQKETVALSLVSFDGTETNTATAS